MSIAFANPDALSHDALEEGSAFAPRFDVNGLVTAIAVEASTNAVLMVAHMNAEALSKTLETGEAHFFSRSRQKLWKKGETSGEIQRVLELRTDCDQDAVLVVVEPLGRGAACHTGRGSCFYRKLEVREGHVALVDTGAPKLFDPEEVYS